MAVEDGLKFFRDEVEEKLRLNEAATQKAQHTLETAKERFAAATKIRVYDREDLLSLVVDEDKEKHAERAERVIASTQTDLDKLALERSNLEALLAHIDKAQNDVREGR
jgi:hypothetical protein